MTSASTYSETGESKPAQSEPDNVQTAESSLDILPVRRLPFGAEDVIPHGRPAEDDDITIIISQLALGHIAAHSYSNLECEVGGALLGRAYQSNGRAYVEVEAALPAVTDDHGPVHFTFTADAWSQLHHDRARRFPEMDIVGWFHTHPDLGVFYSSDDVVVHSAAFTMPWHIGFVVDPIRKEANFFGWKNKAIKPYSGFYELKDLQPDQKLEWGLVETAVWDHPYDYGYTETQPGPSQVFLPQNVWPSMPTLKSYAGFIVGVCGLLLSLFLLVGLVRPLMQEVDRLQNMVIVLADSALADSNAATCPDSSLRILTPLNSQSIKIGSSIEVTGTALVANAVGYEVNARPVGIDTWTLIDSQNRDTKLGTLAKWDTTGVPPGDFELRLTAVDRNNIRLPDSPPCNIAINLTP